MEHAFRQRGYRQTANPKPWLGDTRRVEFTDHPLPTFHEWEASMMDAIGEIIREGEIGTSKVWWYV